MGITGVNPTGEVIGIRIIDTALLTFSLRTPDHAGTAGDSYVAPKELSFTDPFCPQNDWSMWQGCNYLSIDGPISHQLGFSMIHGIPSF